MPPSLTDSRQRQRLRDRVWRVAELVTTPLLPSDYLDLFDPLRSGADLRGKVVDVRAETADSATVTIRPGRGWKGHVPGQYVRIGIDINGVRHWRAYSLTSHVGRADGLITITPKAIPDGLVSHELVYRTQPGTLLMLDQATGDFVLPTPPPAKVLFVTAGSGITPVMGMLRGRLDELPDAVLLHSAPTPDSVLFGPQLRAWAAQGRLALLERHTDLEGMLDLAELDGLVPDWRDREVWLCGPTGLLDAAEEHWAAAGVADRLHIERFRPSVIVAGEGGVVTFVKNGAVVEADGATPILDAAEDAGVLMPSGCRMGICFRCVLPLREGAVRDLRTGELTYAVEGDDIRIQTCVSAAAGTCEIDH